MGVAQHPHLFPRELLEAEAECDVGLAAEGAELRAAGGLDHCAARAAVVVYAVVFSPRARAA